jgi:hypothetical protein
MCGGHVLITIPMHHEAIIYVKHAKIVFTIKDKKEKFSFKSRMLHTLA